MMRMAGATIIGACLGLAASLSAFSAPPPGTVQLASDGGWCWFQDERAIVVGEKLVVGCVAAGRNGARRGDVLALVYDLRSGDRQQVVLHDGLGADDHNAPAFVELADGRVLAVYATHGQANAFWSRRSAVGDPTRWEPPRKFVPRDDSRITYSNLLRLSSEPDRVYNFFRGFGGSWKPSFAYSDDGGQSWHSGGVLIRVPGAARHRPYVKYASDGSATIHVVYTEGHPRDYDNSLYHVMLTGGKLQRSDGSRIGPWREGLARPDLGTRIFAGDERNVAWPCDLHVDAKGRPVVVYSVQKDPRRLSPGHPESGQDHRYRYARWDGTRWLDGQIAYAGTRLYAGEDDYTGLA